MLKWKKSASCFLPRWGQHFNSGMPTGTFLKQRKWKPSLSLLSGHQIKNSILAFFFFFFFFFILWYRKTTCVFPLLIGWNRNFLLAPLLSLRRGAAGQTQQYSSNHFKDHQRMTVLFYLIPYLRAKVPTGKQGADHALFFHAHRVNLVKL